METDHWRGRARPRPLERRDVLGGRLVARPAGALAARQRNQHGDLLAVPAVLVAELSDEVPLFEPDADQNVARGRQRKQQMTRGHIRGGPESEQEAQIDRVSDMPVEQRRVKLRFRWLSAERAGEDLAQPEQLEMADQKRAR